MAKKEAKKGVKRQDLESVDFKNPLFFVVAIVFVSAAGLAALDLGKALSNSQGDGITGTIVNIESSLGSGELVSCSSQSGCAKGTCVENYCVIDLSGQASQTSNKDSSVMGVTGAVVSSLFSKPQLVKCKEGGSECPSSSVCEQGVCMVKVSESQLADAADAKFFTGSCTGYCGGQSLTGCRCDDVCAEYGDCCPDYKQACVAR